MSGYARAPCAKVWRVKGKQVALAVVVALLALPLLASAVWAEWTFQVIPFERRDVAMPAQNASPQEIVAAYIDALDAHDCDTAEALWLSDKDTPRTWCSDFSSAQMLGQATALFHESPRRIHFEVTLRIRWRPFKDDGTFGDDPFLWGYTLTRDSRGAWRIVDNGMP